MMQATRITSSTDQRKLHQHRPPRADPYSPTNLTYSQTVELTRSRIPWHLWLQQQNSLGHIPNDRRGPPALHREMPNRSHIRLYEDPSADTLNGTQRMLGYLQSNLPWSAYLNTLPPIACRHYLNMPPSYSDIHTEIAQSLDQPLKAARFSLTFLGGNPPAPVTTMKV